MSEARVVSDAISHILGISMHIVTQ